MRNPTRPRRLLLEQLEDRIVPTTNLILTAQVPGTDNYNLMVYTQQGTQVSSQKIPPAPGGSSDYVDARGLTVEPSGNVDVFDGTFQPSLATLSAAANQWSFQSYSGWSTVNNVTYGEVAAYKSYVFASDMATAYQPQNGIIRFNDNGSTPTLFGQGHDFIQVALGLNGLLYGLNSDSTDTFPTIYVYNPDTLQQVKTISFTGGPDPDIRSIAVDASGQIYAATWGGYLVHYDPSGNYVSSIQPNVGFTNIALDNNGQIAASSGNSIYLTDTSLDPVQTFSTGQWTVFVTFDHYIGTGSLIATRFNSLSAPTITNGQSTVTLGGQITAGSSFPSGSVNITLNGVTKSAAINASNGDFATTFDTAKLPVGSYTVQYSYPGNSTFAPASSSTTLTDSYGTKLLYNPNKGVNPGMPLHIEFEALNASGADLSSSSLKVTAVQIVDSNGHTSTPKSYNNDNPGNVFKVVKVLKNSAYLYTLDTSGLTAGKYKLLVQIGNDPLLHALTFTIN